MITQEMRESMEREYGQLMTISEIAKWSGRSRDWVRYTLTKDLEYYPSGKRRLYYAADVARAINSAKRKC